jgi:S-adenosylmethionine:tRNA ribosyltransferase-isomerase
MIGVAAGRLPATAPPEAGGLARDEVRLLVARAGRIEHTRFRDLARFIGPGDVLIVNDSATLPAAVEGTRSGERIVTVHFSTDLGNGAWAVEVRPPVQATGPLRDLERGERIILPDGADLMIVAPHADSPLASPRLWRATLAGASALDLFSNHGLPIRYGYQEATWPLSAYQTLFARLPGSAEMPSAGRPFTRRLVSELEARGVEFASITLHTGVSSLEADEPPYPEPFRVPDETAERVNHALGSGGRVIAVGTTAARAIETVADPSGRVRAGVGWTDLVLGPDRPARTLSGLVTGWHAEGSSHLWLVEAIAGVGPVAQAYREAERAGYLWHEFGDSSLFLSDR